MKTSWLKETARDLFAFGSVPFYFLVIVRAVIGEYSTFINQMVIGGIAIFVLYLLIKDSNLHLARAFTIVVFTSIFYDAILYTVFAVAIWTLMFASAYYLKRKLSPILRGVIIGVLSSVAGYYGEMYLL